MQKIYDTSEIKKIPGAKIAILQSNWHSEHTNNMITACSNILSQADVVIIDRHLVPGSYELPLAAKLLAKQKKYDAIIVFGAILKGQTDHYQVILETCIRELGKVIYDFEIPIIMELMPVHDLQHLISRSQGPQNKGLEAAQATIDIILWLRSLTD